MLTGDAATRRADHLMTIQKKQLREGGGANWPSGRSALGDSPAARGSSQTAARDLGVRAISMAPPSTAQTLWHGGDHSQGLSIGRVRRTPGCPNWLRLLYPTAVLRRASMAAGLDPVRWLEAGPAVIPERDRRLSLCEARPATAHQTM